MSSPFGARGVSALHVSRFNEDRARPCVCPSGARHLCDRVQRGLDKAWMWMQILPSPKLRPGAELEAQTCMVRATDMSGHQAPASLPGRGEGVPAGKPTDAKRSPSIVPARERANRGIDHMIACLSPQHDGDRSHLGSSPFGTSHLASPCCHPQQLQAWSTTRAAVGACHCDRILGLHLGCPAQARGARRSSSSERSSLRSLGPAGPPPATECLSVARGAALHAGGRAPLRQARMGTCGSDSCGARWSFVGSPATGPSLTRPGGPSPRSTLFSP